MVEVSNEGELTLITENKVTDAIFKIIKTKANAQEAEFALACSGGLYFARYEQDQGQN